MDKSRQIEESVQKLAGTYLKNIASVIFCTVESIDRDERTCDCIAINDQATTSVPGVQLSAESNNGIVVFPAIGSTVIVALSTHGNAFILMTSDIDEIFIYIDDPNGGNPTVFDVKSGLQQFNDGSFGGLVKVIELTSRIQRLENMMNTHIHSGVTTGAGVSGVNSTPIAPITTQAEIENTLIKHGI